MLLCEFHAIEAFWKKCSVFAEFWTKKVDRKLNLFEWWQIFFFSQNLFIKSVLAIGTLYSLIFCFFKVVYGIVFGVTHNIQIISFGVRQLKNRKVTPNGEEILSKYCICTCLHYRGVYCSWRCLPQGLSCIWTCLHYRGMCCFWRFLHYRASAASGRVCTTEECAVPGGVYTTEAWAASWRVCTTEECTAPGGVYTTEASAASGRVCTSEECAVPGGIYTTEAWAASGRVCTTEECTAPGGVCHRAWAEPKAVGNLNIFKKLVRCSVLFSSALIPNK